MHHFCLQDAIELDTAERLRRFQHAVVDIFSQNWELSNPQLPAKPMWIAQDVGQRLAIIRGLAQPMTASCFQPQALGRAKYWALTSNKPYRVIVAERESLLGAGEVVVLSNAHACSVICNQAHISSAFVIDGEAFEAILPRPQSILGRSLSCVPDASEPLRKLITLAWTCSQSGCLDRASPRLIRAFVEQLALIELVESATASESAESSACTATPHADCRNQVKAFIDAHFRQPELTISQVASSLGLSTRYIQLCFSMADETASGYLRRKRILAAAGMLRSLDARDLSVTDIVYACGFSSSSYFANEFKAAFGLTASRFRELDTLATVEPHTERLR